MDKKNDYEMFAMLLARTAAYFDVSLSMMKIEAYWELLASYPLEEIAEAIVSYCRNPDGGKYFPKASEIIAAIYGDESLRAWTKVTDAIARIGGYSSVAFDDPLIHAVIRDMGGWRKLCLLDKRQLSFVAKEFRERYRGYVFNPPLSYPSYLPGLFEKPVIMIGDADKASLVIASGSKPPLQ